MLCQLASILLMLAGCPDPGSSPSGYPNGLVQEEKDETALEKGDTLETITELFGTLVGTSPYPGVRSTFAGNHLMAQLSQVNQDLDLLIGHDRVEKYYKSKGYAVKNPHVMLSGKVEGTGFISEDPTGRPQSGINLTGAELDMLIAYKAITGFMVIQYEDFPNPVINSRLATNNLFLDVAFVTIGDLNVFPMYTTIGQTFVPFGQYNSYNGFNDPLTEILFRVLAQDATIGYYDNRFLGQFYFLQGESHADSGNNINNFGLNLGVHFNPGITKNLFQAGFIRNIADGLGFQVAFANTRNTNKLKHVVPGLNFNGSTQIGDHWFFVYEFNTALRPFAIQDAGYSTNGGKTFKGARPLAFDVEASYQFNIGERPSGIALGFSETFQSVGFNVPKWRLDLTYSVYIFKGALLSIEYMHNKLYGKNDVATGQLAFGPGGSTPYYRLPAYKGHSDDTLTIDLSYFW
ncbi:MAG TPA: LbtU family siderophore porin [Chlamydiales bacterium]|nr:LbtU family siderophore porin [Chlamydiales bacterium]